MSSKIALKSFSGPFSREARKYGPMSESSPLRCTKIDVENGCLLYHEDFRAYKIKFPMHGLPMAV